MTTNNTKLSRETLCEFLDAAALEPLSGVEKAAAKAGVSRTAIYNWQRQSQLAEKSGDKDSIFYLEWCGIVAPFHRHIQFARAINVQQLDAKIREMALIGTEEKMWITQTGEPVWKINPEIAGYLKTHDAIDCELMFGQPDAYVRDDRGALVQETKRTPPNPTLIHRVCASVLPDVYGEFVQHTVSIGGVVRINSREPAMIDVTPAKQLEDKSEDEDGPPLANTFVVGERFPDTDEGAKAFQQKFGGRRIVPHTMFYNADGKPELPIEGVIIVEGSSVHEEYKKHGVEVPTVPAQQLLDQGYANSFLLKMCSDDELRSKLEASHQVPPPRQYVRPDVRPVQSVRPDRTEQAPADRTTFRPIKPGYASGDRDSERIGHEINTKGGARVNLGAGPTGQHYGGYRTLLR